MSKINLLKTVSLLIFLVLSVQLFSQNLAVSLIPEQLKKNVNSVLRYDNTTIEISKSYDMTITSEWAVTVLNSSGNEHVYAGSSYSKSLKINEMTARILDANGKEIKKLKSSDLVDVSAVMSGSVFVDDRQQYFTYGPGSYPYTFVFKLVTKNKNTAFLPDWNPLTHDFQSVESSKFTLNYPENWNLSTNEKNLESFGVTKSTGPGKYSLEISQAMPITKEYGSPPYYEIKPYASLSANYFQLENIKGQASDWNEFGEWYQSNMLRGNELVPENTRKEILSLVEGLTDSIEIARKVYAYVQQKTRYVSVQIGIGGWKPMTVASVDELKYGDCKALSFYTQALLKVAGLPATYTIIHSGNYPTDLDTTLVSVQGNHVIVSIPLKDTTIWLETTNRHIPFGYLGDFTDNRAVLSLSEKGTKLDRTPAYADNANKQETVAKVSLDADGMLKASLTCRSSGLQYDDKYYLELQKKDENEKFYQKTWNYLQFLKLTKIDLKADKHQIVFEENIELEAQKYGEMSGNRMLFQANFFNRNTFVPPRIADRKQKLVLPRGYYDTDSYEVELPVEYDIEALPSKAEIDSRFGQYELSVERISDHKLLITRSYLKKNGSFAAEDYSDYIQFRRDVARHDQSKIILIKK
ncbi:MAG: DUF3857 domain-containing protein [Bacteroidetes bacterium]|nr:DUF3857 domain-containing protein [Bacteroidota bacterium]